jgi:UDP-N-acetylmuramoyl-L-alanyl-D-glutamate--2,6-diaminopimelate ligase
MEQYRDLGALWENAGVRYMRHFRNIGVTGVAVDSREVRPGNIFVAIDGESIDGHRYLQIAVERGAAALVVEREDFPGPNALPRMPLAVVKDSRAAAAHLAASWYGHPAENLTMVGVTGTNGKTTIAYLLRSIFEMAGRSVGMLGTTGYFIRSRSLPAPTTTPGPVALQKMLADMLHSGVTHAVMEVSSHALVQKRTLGMAFDAAVFSNLRSDHMDYHSTRSDYLKAKGTLFSMVRPGGSVVLNADDWASVAYAAQAEAHVRYYSRRHRADLRARVVAAGLWGTELSFRWRGREFPVHLAMPGLHNVENASAAALAALSLGVDPPDVADGLAAMRCVPGRLEPVPSDHPFDVFVDYAHTDDALEAVLSNLAPRCEGRLLLVFGCGGDRDTTKRPRMARVAEKWADFSIVTSDNPRSEDPMLVIRDIVCGFSSRQRYLINPDRASAIDAAMSMARPGDTVLIAGKGHENYQEIKGERYPFDDREVAEAVLATLPDDPSGEARSAGSFLDTFGGSAVRCAG